MDGHWEWSDSGDEPDTGDTADLSGDPGFGQGYEHGFEAGHTFDGHDDFGGGDALGGDPHGGGDDLEEPLGTEHAAQAYDQSVDESGHDGDGFDTTDGDPAQHADFDPVTDPADHTDHTEHAEHSEHVEHAGDTTGHPGAEDVEVDAVHHAETFGSDPDLRGDDGWPESVFPEELHLDGPPEPVDGFPWSDADVLGGPDDSLSASYDPATHTDPASPADLASYEAGYDGMDLPAGADPWSLLLQSDDPATSSLAGFWAPNT
jgi:hypothetical protein